MVVAVVARPIGGWLCDRFDKTRVLAGLLAATGLFALLAALVGGGRVNLALEPVGTVAFLGMAAGLGAGAGLTPVEGAGRGRLPGAGGG